MFVSFKIKCGIHASELAEMLMKFLTSDGANVPSSIGRNRSHDAWKEIESELNNPTYSGNSLLEALNAWASGKIDYPAYKDGHGDKQQFDDWVTIKGHRFSAEVLCSVISVTRSMDGTLLVEASGGRRSFYMNYTGDMARWLISGEAGGIVEDSIKVDSAAWLKVDTETDNLFMPTLATQVRDFLIGQPYGVDSHKEGVLGGVHDEKIIATALQLIDLLSPEEYRDQQL